MKFKAFAFIIIISAIMLSSLPKSEQQLFHAVGGYVRDSDGNGINNVVVYVKNLDKNVTKTAVTQTGDEKGAYTTLFLENEFEWGDTLYVEAKKGALYGNNSTVFIDTGLGYQIVNVTVHYTSSYALAISPTGISNESNISIIYNFTGIPDYVSIYYSNDGNSTWHLAGNDTSVDGIYNFSLPVDGIYGFIAVAVGNGSLEEKPLPGDDAEAYPYILDTVPPSINITSPQNNSYAKSKSKLQIKWTSNDSMDENLSITFQYNMNGGAWGSPWHLPDDGSFNWTLLNFPDGSIVGIRLNALDDAGNINSDEVYIIIDNQPPFSSHSISPSSPDGNNGWYISNVSIEIFSHDNGSGVKTIFYRINNITWMNYTQNFSVKENGSYFIEYYAVDFLGNEENAKNFSLKIDKEKPSTSISLNPSLPNGKNGWYVSNVTVEFYAHDNISNIYITKYSIDNSTWMNYTSAFNISANGIHYVRYFSIDNAGNEEMIKNKTIKIDKNPPNVIYTLPQNNSIAPVSSEVIIIFNESMNTTSIPSLIQLSGYNPGNWSYEWNTTYIQNDTLIFSHNPWNAGDSIKIYIEGYEDFAGNTGNYTWSFETQGECNALAISPTGISNESNISIIYNFTGIPDYVSIYYSNDGNSTWHLAGNDTSVDGIYNFSLPVDGIYGFIAVAVGNGSLEEKPLPGDDAEAYPYILDTVPPSISIENGSPFYNEYITSATSIYINASDLHPFNIYYRIWNGSWNEWKIQSANISFNIYEECIHYVEYYARDSANNSSPLFNATFYVDNTPPETFLNLSGISGENGWYVSNVSITLNSTDYGCGGSGIASTYYKIENEWIEYNESFLIGEGIYNISYYSVDVLGNEEEVKNASIKIDFSPPFISLVEFPPSITNNFTIFFEWSVSDLSNNISFSYSLINYSNWSNWSNSTCVYFNLTSEGNYTFILKAKDEAGNLAFISYNFSVDMEAIITTIKFIPRYNEWISLHSIINLTCYGNVNSTYYRIWYNGSWHPEPSTGVGKEHNFFLYNKNFSMSNFSWTGEGQCYIEFYSDDINSNEEEIKNESIMIDATPPSTFLSIKKSFTNEKNISFNISVYDNVGVEYIKLYYSYSEIKNFTSSNWSYFSNYSPPYNITFSFGEVGYYAFISIGVDYLNNTEIFPSQPDEIVKFYNPDLNGDGRVNVLDLIKVIIKWMHTPSNENWDHKIDLNGDEIIDAEDLIILIFNWTG